METSDIALRVAIAGIAIAFAIWTGPAKAARLRALQDDVTKGLPRGYLVVVAVGLAVIATVMVAT